MNASSMGYPGQRGLYSPAFEHDACGIGMIVDIAGRRSHKSSPRLWTFYAIWNTGAEQVRNRTRVMAQAS